MVLLDKSLFHWIFCGKSKATMVFAGNLDMTHKYVSFLFPKARFQLPSEEETDLSKLITTTLFYG